MGRLYQNADKIELVYKGLVLKIIVSKGENRDNGGKNMNNIQPQTKNAEESKGHWLAGVVMTHLKSVIAGVMPKKKVAHWMDITLEDGAIITVPTNESAKYPANEGPTSATAARKVVKDLFNAMRTAQTTGLNIVDVEQTIKLSQVGLLASHKTMASAQKEALHIPKSNHFGVPKEAFDTTVAQYKLGQFISAMWKVRQFTNPSTKKDTVPTVPYSLDGVDVPLKTVRTKMLMAYKKNMPTITVNGVEVDYSGTRHESIAKAACLLAGYANGLFYDCATSKVTPSSVSVQDLTPVQISNALGVDLSTLKTLLKKIE